MSEQTGVEKIRDLIKGIKIAMLTTKNPDGTMHSRPMQTQDIEFDGDLWFFTAADADKVAEIRLHPSVNVAFSGDNKYVSLAGTAQIVSDVAKKRELWNPAIGAFFEDEGPESPKIVLIHVMADSAQYWDGPSGFIGKTAAFIKVLVTRKANAAGDSQKVEL